MTGSPSRAPRRRLNAEEERPGATPASNTYSNPPRYRDALPGLAINNFENFSVTKAKHSIPTTYDGDVILFRPADEFNLIGPA